MAPLARSALLARAFRARAGTARQTFTRVSRRTYASGHEHAPRQAGIAGDLPWLVSSVAVTAGGLYLLWPEPSKAGHGHGHDEHADEHKEEKDDGEQQQQEESKDEDSEGKEDDSKDKEDDSKNKEADSKSEDNQKEESEGSASDDKKKTGTKESPKTNKDRDDGNTEVKYDDAKGGVKKRLESDSAIKQGNKGDNPKGQSANVHSGQGEHVYNTDTKHSTDAQNEPDLSNKGEGDVETAKVKKPVDPNRPQK